MRLPILAATAAFAAASPSVATTWHVAPDGSGDAPSIHAAIQAAAPGDTVEAACGIYYEHDIELKGGVVLRGATGQPGCVTVNAMQLGPVLRCVNQTVPARVEGLAIVG
ncbi:hypothetical protein K8I85_13830, partial [bacterium]|nr:hypothetical protein [bacterium]